MGVGADEEEKKEEEEKDQTAKDSTNEGLLVSHIIDTLQMMYHEKERQMEIVGGGITAEMRSLVQQNELIDLQI